MKITEQDKKGQGGGVAEEGELIDVVDTGQAFQFVCMQLIFYSELEMYFIHTDLCMAQGFLDFLQNKKSPLFFPFGRHSMCKLQTFAWGLYSNEQQSEEERHTFQHLKGFSKNNFSTSKDFQNYLWTFLVLVPLLCHQNYCRNRLLCLECFSMGRQKKDRLINRAQAAEIGANK